jgi:uncharacterized protein (TIRG00374 family)
MDPTAGDGRDDSPGSPWSAPSRIPLRKIAIVVLGAVLVVTAMTVVGDARELGHQLSGFDWRLVAPILVLTLWNYLLRFIKWEIYLGAIGVTGLRRLKSAQIFLSGFAMSVTPGKVGEFIKSVYVRRETGSPANPVMAVVTAERATDAAAMAILALIGATRYSYGRGFVLLALTGGLVVLLILQRPRITEQVVARLSRFERVSRLSEQINSFFRASAILLRPRLLAPTVGLSVLSWSGECFALFLVLIGLGIDGSLELVLIAAFVIGISSLAGGFSMLPGGLGVADASMAGMLVLLVHDDAMTRSVAVAATLLIRFATLWFGVLIGAIALTTLEKGKSSSDFSISEREQSAPAPPN